MTAVKPAAKSVTEVTNKKIQDERLAQEQRKQNLQTLKVLIDQKFIKVVAEMQPVNGQLKTVTKFILAATGRNPATVPIAFCPVSGMSLSDVHEGEIVSASQTTFGNGDNADS